jgi:LDH2 family malate/lactate/ureidoglycolate dehydrogenase
MRVVAHGGAIARRPQLIAGVTTQALSDRRGIEVPPDKGEWVAFDDLEARIEASARRYVDAEHAAFLAEKLVLAERMGVPTHGLHYYLHSILPHLRDGRINDAPIRVRGSLVLSSGTGGVGFLHLWQCLDRASKVASEQGVALAVLKMPGKVGALRVFCQDLMDRSQLVLMAKNTARTVGTQEMAGPIFGTNPLCIGLPQTRFIYDSTMSTVATNKIRYFKKLGRTFEAPIGVDSGMRETGDPNQMMAGGGFLLPFSFGTYWFKSFFLGIAIEAMAALAGGSTGHRTGEHTGKRLHSREGMIAIVIDGAALPDYAAYQAEVATLLSELEEHGLRIPGDYDRSATGSRVLASDWYELLQP